MNIYKAHNKCALTSKSWSYIGLTGVGVVGGRRTYDVAEVFDTEAQRRSVTECQRQLPAAAATDKLLCEEIRLMMKGERRVFLPANSNALLLKQETGGRRTELDRTDQAPHAAAIKRSNIVRRACRRP